MRGLLTRLAVLLRDLRRPAETDADMQDEMRFHIDMEADRLVRERGLAPQEARRQATLAFGGIEKYRGAGRDALGLTWVRGVSLDLKLGVRMLGKYPGLTTVAVIALALAIGAGAAYLEFVQDLLHGRLPFRDSARIVGIQTWDTQSGEPEGRATFDFTRWRGSLSSFDDLGAYRPLDRNLITGDGRSEPIRGVEISASAFRIAGVTPEAGRYLFADDERPDAAPVVVIGHDVWVNRFGSDPRAVGQQVHLGQDAYTVVGVMPAGFGFPVSHSVWVPLRLNDAAYAPRAGAPIKIFGRLADRVSLEQGQAELTAIAVRTAQEFPGTHERLRPVVKPYVESLWSAVEDSGIQTAVLYTANIFFVALLALCGANVATLVFARTVTRELELSVRTALGASRARIAGQLFAEALVLASIAGSAGLLTAMFGLGWVKDTITTAQGNRLMFWWNDRLSPSTIVYAAVLTIGAAVITGVVPALKATGPRVQDRLKQSLGAASGARSLGRTWTAVIVTQVALTVVFLSVAGTLVWGRFYDNSGDREVTVPGPAQYSVARLTLDRDAAAGTALDDDFRARYGEIYQEFARRLAADPAVAAVTYASQLPGMKYYRRFIDLATGSAADGIPIRATSVGAGFFETMQARLVAGRGITDADLQSGRRVAVVDQTFVRRVLGGHEAIGRQFREAARDGGKPGPWFEIVGVVADMTADRNKDVGDAAAYLGASAGAAYPVSIAVRAAADPARVQLKLRSIAAEVDAGLRVNDLTTLDKLSANDRVAIAFFGTLSAGISAVALLLSTAGVYALLAFAVARRTGEIGIRVALGADRHRILASTFARAFVQIVAGVVIGSVPAALIVTNLAPEVSVAPPVPVALSACATVAAFMVVVTTLACVAPARRVLRIQAADALRTT